MVRETSKGKVALTFIIMQYVNGVEMTERVNLSPISMLKLTLLMDNVTDRLLPNPYPFVKRAPMIANQKVLPSPVAEHGFSVLLEVANTKKESSDSQNKIKNDKSSKK